MSSGIVLHTAAQAGAQRVVVIVGDKEHLVVIQPLAVKVDVIVVGVVPVVVPHAHSNVHGIGLEQQAHIGHLLDPSVELAVREPVELVHEVHQLQPCTFKLFGLGLERVGMAVVGVIIIPDVTVGIVQACGSVAALPQEAVTGAETAYTVLEVAFVDGLHHLIDAIVCLLAVALDMQPQPAVVVTHGSPHPCTLKEFIAEHLAHVGGVVLEPLEVQLAHTLDGVVLVVHKFPQIHTEVGMVPVGVVALVHASVPSLRPPARGVSLETQPHVVNHCGLAFLDKRDGR